MENTQMRIEVPNFVNENAERKRKELDAIFEEKRIEYIEERKRKNLRKMKYFSLIFSIAYIAIFVIEYFAVFYMVYKTGLFLHPEYSTSDIETFKITASISSLIFVGFANFILYAIFHKKVDDFDYAFELDENEYCEDYKKYI